MEPVRTLPAWTYRSPAFHRAEREAIFRSGWLLAGHVCQLERPGDYVTLTVAGEPILTIRGGDGRLRAFSNVCRHRAARVADGAGNCGKALRCPYHGWTYGLDGRLLGVPERSGFPGFDKDANALWPLRCDEAAGFVFVNLAPDPEPLADYLGGLPEFLAPYRPERLVPFASGSSVLPFNWKVVVDNYLEGYHIPLVHPTLHKELDDAKYQVEPKRYYSIQHAPLRGAGAADESRLYKPDAANEAAQYYWLFPNMMLNVYFGQLQTNVVLPDGHDRTTVVFEWFALDQSVDPAGDEWARRVAFSDTVQEEDRQICEAVQRNLRSRVYDRGRYAPRQEQGVHHFHALLHEFLS
jgi:choline monooxygenase